MLRWPFVVGDESVSRVLYAAPKGNVSTIYLGQSSRKGSINLPTDAGRAARCQPEGWRARLFGLSTPEVYPAETVTRPLVRSYRTFSPLPFFKILAYSCWLLALR
jgi:hypothetical protein